MSNIESVGVNIYQVDSTHQAFDFFDGVPETPVVIIERSGVKEFIYADTFDSIEDLNLYLNLKCLYMAQAEVYIRPIDHSTAYNNSNIISPHFSPENEGRIDIPETGFYKQFDRQEAFECIEKIYHIAKADIENPRRLRELQNAFEQTQTSINNMYDIYEGKRTFEDVFSVSLENVDYAFMVPARGEFPSEARSVLPIVDFLKSYENDEHRRYQRDLMNKLCPFNLAMYENSENEIIGVCVYCPQDINYLGDLFEVSTKIKNIQSDVKELLRQIRSKPMEESYRVLKDLTSVDTEQYERQNILRHTFDISMLSGQAISLFINNPLMLSEIIRNGSSQFAENVGREQSKSVNEAVSFIQKATNHGINRISLGATLPLVTARGRNLDASRLGVEIGTGHRMTVLSMVLTLDTILQEREIDANSEFNVGIFGGGNIGLAAGSTTLDKYPNAKIIVYDIDKSKRNKIIKELGDSDRVIFADSADDLLIKLGESKIVFSAVTSKLQVKDSSLYEGMSMIDDSEPSSGHLPTIHSHGGEVHKPSNDASVVKIKDKNGYIHTIRRTAPDYVNGGIGQYNYGYEQGQTEFTPGLIGPWTMFSCEFEAWLSSVYELMNPDLETNPVLYARKVTAKSVRQLEALVGEYVSQSVHLDAQQINGFYLKDLREDPNKGRALRDF